MTLFELSNLNALSNRYIEYRAYLWKLEEKSNLTDLTISLPDLDQFSETKEFRFPISLLKDMFKTKVDEIRAKLELAGVST